MALILAIEPDGRQAAHLTNLVRDRLGADLVLADTTEGALMKIGTRVPDLVLVPSLLSSQEDAALAGALRAIAEAARVQMLTIPMFADAAPQPKRLGVLAKLRRGRAQAASTDGCDPSVFGEQIAAYLAEAAAARAAAVDDNAIAEPYVEPVIEPYDESLAAPVLTVDETWPTTSAPFTQSVVQPIAESIDEPVDEPIAERVIEPLYDPFEETAIDAILAAAPVERFAEAVPEPIAEVVADLVAESMSDPGTEPISEPVAELISEPVAQPIAEPVAELTAEPVAELVVECVAEPIVAPGVEPIDEPTAQSLEPSEATVIDAVLATAPIEVVEEPRAESVVEAVEAASYPEPIVEQALETSIESITASSSPVPDEAPVVVEASTQFVVTTDTAVDDTQSEPIVEAASSPSWLDRVMREILERFGSDHDEPAAAPVNEAPVYELSLEELRNESAAETIDTVAVVADVPTEIEADADVPIQVEAAPQALIPAAEPAPLPPAIEIEATSPVLDEEVVADFISALEPLVGERFVGTFAVEGLPSGEELSQSELDRLFLMRAGVKWTVDERPTPAPPPPATQEDKPEWVALIESLRSDIERLRSDRKEPTLSPRELNRAKREATRRQRVKPVEKKPRPAQDQWGMFDPDQCGFAALLAKLDEITETGDEASR